MFGLHGGGRWHTDGARRGCSGQVRSIVPHEIQLSLEGQSQDMTTQGTGNVEQDGERTRVVILAACGSTFLDHRVGVVVKYPAKKARNVEGDRVGAYGVGRGLKVMMSGRNQNQNTEMFLRPMLILYYHT